MTTFLPSPFSLRVVPKAAENFTTSSGESDSPTLPPIVPRIPDIDFIKVTVF
jgi:hypothetical protein